MDQAYVYLMEAQSYIDSFIDISLADSFFEETDEAKNANINNQKAQTGALGSIKKAIDALVEMVKKIISNITNFLKERFMSKDERERYKQFKGMVKADPELAKKKVTIVDFREYEKAYDEALKELEKEAQKEEPSNEIGEAIVKKLQDKINDLAGKGKDIASRAALATTLDTAIDIADRNVTCAKAINFALENELIKLDEVQKQLGDKEVAKFQKKIKKLANAGWLHRFKVKVLQRKELTLEAVLKNQTSKLLSFTNVKNGKLEKGKSIIDSESITRGIAKNPGLTTKALGGPKEAAKVAKDVALTSMKMKQAERDIKNMKKKGTKEAKEFFQFMGVKKK